MSALFIAVQCTCIIIYSHKYVWTGIQTSSEVITTILFTKHILRQMEIPSTIWMAPCKCSKQVFSRNILFFNLKCWLPASTFTSASWVTSSVVRLTNANSTYSSSREKHRECNVFFRTHLLPHDSDEIEFQLLRKCIFIAKQHVYVVNKIIIYNWFVLVHRLAFEGYATFRSISLEFCTKFILKITGWAATRIQRHFNNTFLKIFFERFKF